MSRPTKLDRLFLSHIGACVPFALVWMIWPEYVTFWPQTPLMATQSYTGTALLLGTALGLGALAVLARWDAG